MLAIFPDWHRQKHGEKSAKMSDNPSHLVIANSGRMCDQGTTLFCPYYPFKGSRSGFGNNLHLPSPPAFKREWDQIGNVFIFLYWLLGHLFILSIL